MKKTATIALAFAVAYGCSSDKGIGPSVPKEQVSLAFCPFFGPTWLAIQNENEGWQAVTVNPSGLTTFQATPKVSVAFVVDFFDNSFTAVLNLSREELQGTPGFTCFDDELLGDEELSGTVAGVTGSQSALIVGGQSVAFVDASLPDWTLEFLQATPVDVVGLRFPTPSTQPPHRIVVRRDQMPTGSAPITLDFEGTGSSTLEQATVTFGNPASDFINMGIDFVTANNTFVDLMDFTTFDGTPAFTYVSVPASLRIDSDMHVINAFTPSDFGGREITHYYKAPANKTLNFGPAMNLPIVNDVTTTPFRRLNATIESQAEYPTAVQIVYDQTIGSLSKAVTIVTTAAFLGGTPTTWQLVIPDMTSAGYQAQWGLTTGGTTHWSVTGYGGDMAVLLGGAPADGATLTTATEDNPISITKTAAYGARRQPAVRGLRRFVTR